MTAHFILTDGPQRSFALNETPSDLATEQNYTLREEKRSNADHGLDNDAQHALSCHYQRDDRTPVKPGDVALLTVAYPLIKLLAYTEGVSLVPGHITATQEKLLREGDGDGDGPGEAVQAMRVPPSSTTSTTYVMLRPDDTICIGHRHRLRLAVASASLEGLDGEQVQVQVDSSLPRAEIDDDSHPQAGVGVGVGKEQGDLGGRSAARELLVERSFRGDGGVSDSMPSLSRTPPRKAPLVEETPASRRRYVDAVSYAEDVEEEYTLVERDSGESLSQELVGAGPPKDAAPVLQDSVEPEGMYATAPSEAIAPRAQGGSIEDNVKPENSRGRKRKSEEEIATSESVDHMTTVQSAKAKKQKKDGNVGTFKPTETASRPKATRGAKQEDEIGSTTPPQVEAQDNPISTRARKRKSSEKVELSESLDAEPTTIATKGKKRKSKDDIEPADEATTKSTVLTGDEQPLADDTEKLQDPSWLKKTPKYSKHATPATSPNVGKSTSKGSAKARRIVFSNSAIPNHAAALKFLSSHGMKQVENTSARGFDMLVVGNGELKKTFKLLTSVALGKPVVTDQWVLQSSSEGKLLEYSSFVPQNSELESHWRFSLSKAISSDHRSLFKGMAILITPALKKEYGSSGFKDVEELGKLVGAKRVISKTFEAAADEKGTGALVIMASGIDDPDLPKWKQQGHTCFSKDLLSVSILRGETRLDDDELKIEIVANHGKTKSRGRPSKAA